MDRVAAMDVERATRHSACDASLTNIEEGAFDETLLYSWDASAQTTWVASMDATWAATKEEP